MLHVKAIRFSGWKLLALFGLFLNLILVLVILELNATKRTLQQTPAYSKIQSLNFFKNKNAQLVDLVTFVLIDFESFENDIPNTVDEICSQTKNINILLITDKKPYPPIQFKASSEDCHLKILTTSPDPTKDLFETRPEYFINTEFILIIPDSTRISSKLLLTSLKISHIYPKQIIAIPVIHSNELIDYYYHCFKLNFDVRRWTLNYEILKNEHRKCDALEGEFAFLIKKDDLHEFNQPFIRPFPLSLFIQAKLKNFEILIDDDIKFYKALTLFSSNTKHESKRNHLEQEREKQLYQQFGIKQVIKNDQTHLFGCTKHSLRCFPTIYKDTPEYLMQGKWTPPCCLRNLKIVFHRVISVLESCKVRYWLEGGSLLGAVRNSSIIPWDYDIDLGIYKEDIKKCEILKLATTNPVKDDENFLWETAIEGQFLRVNLSPTNRLHVDIFPFYSRRGVMTKNTWFDDHPQDKEFNETYLKPMEKILFLDLYVNVPNNARKFLEFKFGKGVIERPSYPNEDLVKYP